MDIGISVNAKISSEHEDQVIGELFRLLGTEAQIRLFPNVVDGQTDAAPVPPPETSELTDAEKVERLRGLLAVELLAAREMERNDYVAGRIHAYEFALDGIENRWP